MIKVVVLGKIKEDYLNKCIDDYKSRISKYHKIEIIELKDDNDITKENESLFKIISSKDYNIALDIGSKQLDSVELANLIDKKLMEKGNICFFVGSSHGLSDEFKSKCDLLLSFGKITMPHGLFRSVLLEQIYRCFKINNNETYHK